MSRRRPVSGAAAGLALVVLAAACTQTLDQATGIVVSVDSPALGRVDAFELLTPEGETLRFDTADLAFREEFPVAHLTEHMRVSEPIVVTFRHDDGERIVTQLDDAGGDGHRR